MKKSLVLAPAVALAISGFGATAVSAAPEDAAPGTDPNTSEESTTTDEAGEAPAGADEGDDTGAGETNSDEEPAPENKTETQADDDAEVADPPQMEIEPEVVEAEALVDPERGVLVSITGLEPNSTVTDSLTNEPETADENGNVSIRIHAVNASASDFEPGQVVPFTVEVTDANGEAHTIAGSFTIAGEPADEETPTPTPTEDDDAAEDDWTWNGAPLEEGLNLEDDQVSTEKFVTDGVAFAVRGCEPGQDVNFEVRAGRDDVAPYTATVTADENGIAVHGVKGLDASQARAYIGEYTVTATCGDESWTDAFYVGDRGDDANPGDDSSDDNGSDDNAGGTELPRTGTELTGLAAGAGLLVIGAATMLLTRRRGAKTGPADI